MPHIQSNGKSFSVEHHGGGNPNGETTQDHCANFNEDIEPKDFNRVENKPPRKLEQNCGHAKQSLF